MSPIPHNPNSPMPQAPEEESKLPSKFWHRLSSWARGARRGAVVGGAAGAGVGLVGAGATGWMVMNGTLEAGKAVLQAPFGIGSILGLAGLGAGAHQIATNPDAVNDAAKAAVSTAGQFALPITLATTAVGSGIGALIGAVWADPEKEYKALQAEEAQRLTRARALAQAQMQEEQLAQMQLEQQRQQFLRQGQMLGINQAPMNGFVPGATPGMPVVANFGRGQGSGSSNG